MRLYLCYAINLEAFLQFAQDDLVYVDHIYDHANQPGDDSAVLLILVIFCIHFLH